ncbi:MAG: GPW/gp25 family protein [Nostoc sp. ZfuVER08]|uniref:GPW/gp25 family protein n=1 Tax=Nostoc punctiforme FACHB-252 TaxID=1357509 RepID=A0ABR8HAH2_NOSPU|nr:GPW/gp25 family protein [Nostoc punctiforme]MBD2612252.1 GPW/gp25 family protein [Nostoc punctiforme FACHB-252]MDZ8015664.1 GPW/gp25 family protein [Nostoc sp. ZfuVER08]
METNDSFLGTGWSFPPTFHQNTGTVEMVSDEKDIIQSLEIILSTRPAERIMQPNFGCELSQFVFEEVTQGLITNIKGTISDALLDHEPRIDVEEIDIDESEAGLLLISVTYRVRVTNSRFNLVYPFYINEAQIL